MYGFIHCCLEDLVVKLFGEETWKEILKRSGVKLRGASFLMHKVYDDEVTLKLIVTTSQVVGLDIETCLEAFGNHFLQYCQKNGYDKILRVLGSNLHDFLTNLDNLHDHLATIYPGMRAPSFRVTHASDGTMHLHYYSERKGLSAIVKGLVMVLSKEFFKTEVIVRTLEECDDGHVILEVLKKYDDQYNSANSEHLTPYNDQHLSALPKDLLFNARTICEAFPFHMIFRRDFRIIQIGNSLFRLTRNLWKTNTKVKFSDLFIISRPVIDCTFELILNYCNQVFVVKSSDQFNNTINESYSKLLSKTNTSNEEPVPNLRLKGQMVPVPESDAILFLCSPRVNGLDEMKKLGLYLTDFPVHDRTRDLILMSHERRGERELVEKLDEATNHIRILETKLRDENKRTEEILHNIFPAKIAQLLCQNIRVKAETFEPVTCLFSDIVGFTAMCGSPNIEPMDIVRLLNRLYIQFDNLTNIYGIYKVETIGDAYVVVGGVPEMVEDHADRIVQMGLAMVKVTHSVISPVDGKPIQMRIGIHSGACMAGIVGLQMPRYCLFGNTVTLANKMESNSKPGQVHISEETRRQLIRDSYCFTDSIQNVFSFSTYFVTKIDDNSSEDYLAVQSNLSTSGGHFRSPSCSPSHSIKANSTAGTPSGETPLVSPLVSPKKTFHDFSFYHLNTKESTEVETIPLNIYNSKEVYDLPDVQISEPTPKHNISISSVEKYQKMIDEKSLSSDKIAINKENIDTNPKKMNAESSQCNQNNSFFKTQSTDTKLMSDLCNTSSYESCVEINEMIVSEKVNINASTTKIDRNSRKRYFLLFCLKPKKHQTVNHVRVKPKEEINLNNISNKKCIKVDGDNGKGEEDMCKQLDSICATTSQTAAKNKLPRVRKQHKICCFSFYL